MQYGMQQQGQHLKKNWELDTSVITYDTGQVLADYACNLSFSVAEISI